jgi:MerR family transcriptional regulator, copper efflux regulator
MLISDFARATGLSVDTVNFYVRRGLLTPQTNGKGGRNPYRAFTEADVVAARFIRFSQSIGMTLAEIAAIDAERRNGGIGPERGLEIMSRQLAQIEERLAELDAMADYLRRKIAWTQGGKAGEAPRLAEVRRPASAPPAARSR